MEYARRGRWTLTPRLRSPTFRTSLRGLRIANRQPRTASGRDWSRCLYQPSKYLFRTTTAHRRPRLSLPANGWARRTKPAETDQDSTFRMKTQLGNQGRLRSVDPPTLLCRRIPVSRPRFRSLAEWRRERFASASCRIWAQIAIDFSPARPRVLTGSLRSYRGARRAAWGVISSGAWPDSRTV